MHPPSAQTPTKRPKESRWLWIPVVVLLGAMVLPFMLVTGVASCFRPGSDTRALFNRMAMDGRGEWQRQITLNIGGFTLGALRSGLSFAQLDTEARALLESVRGVEFGIYLPSGDADSWETLAAADTAMNASGWDRVVGVIDGRTMVAVYVPARIDSPRQMKCCVMVFEGERMIVVSARTNPEPLVRCLLRHPALRERMQLLAKR